MIYTITSRRQLSLSPEEIDLLIHACWTTRKQVHDEIHEATDEGRLWKGRADGGDSGSTVGDDYEDEGRERVLKLGFLKRSPRASFPGYDDTWIFLGQLLSIERQAHPPPLSLPFFRERIHTDHTIQLLFPAIRQGR